MAASFWLCVGPAPIGAADVVPAADSAVADAPPSIVPDEADAAAPVADQATPQATPGPAGGAKGKELPPQPSPSPAAKPRPTKSPDPRANRRKGRKVSVGIESYTNFIDQHFVGPGIVPPEATFFAPGAPIAGLQPTVCVSNPVGAPLGSVRGAGNGTCGLYAGLNVVAPTTPYDFLSGSPLTTGNGIHQATLLTPSLHVSPAIDWSATVGYGSIGGVANVASYWGERAMSPINAHQGQHPVSDDSAAAFPTGPKQNTTNASRVTFLNTTFQLHDNLASLRGGWFDPLQSVGHVFAPAVSPQTVVGAQPLLGEGLSDGAPGLDSFKPLPQTLQLYGFEGAFKVRKYDVELIDAQIPAPADTPARVLSASVVSDRGHGLSYGAQIARVFTSGVPVFTTSLNGGAPGLIPSYAGQVPFSTLGGQKMLVGGVQATFPLTADIDGALKFGHSCYGASGTALPASKCVEGSYYYAKVHHGFRAYDVALEAVRFEANYAPLILPYGTVENTWTAPFAFPSPTYKNDYAFVDTHLVGANRQGVRVSSTFVFQGVETRLAYGQYGQILPYDKSTAYGPGFTEGYFLPQLNSSAGTLGGEQHFSATFLAKPKFANLQLELSDVTTSRAATPFHSEEAVAMNYPSWVFSASRVLRPGKLFGSVGAGQTFVQGSYDNSGPKNLSFTENVVFAGLQWMQNPTSGYSLQYRLYSVNGNPLIPSGPSPAFHGPQFYLEQRLKT